MTQNVYWSLASAWLSVGPWLNAHTTARIRM